MKRDEQDEHVRRQTEAAEATAMFSLRFAEALERPQREARARELDAMFPPLRRTFHGEHGVKLLATAIPGFAGLWDREVPSGHLIYVVGRANEPYVVVLCSCGAQTALEPGGIAKCAGARWLDSELLDPEHCGRYFLATRDAVRWHDFNESEAT